MTKFLVPFLVSFFSAVGLILSAIYFGKKINWSARKENRHIHNKNIFRLGGVAIIVAFNLALILDNNLFIDKKLYGVIIASVFLLVYGIWDDLKEISWKIQIFFQVILALFIFLVGIRIHFFANPLSGKIINLDFGWGIIFSVLITIAWIILMMNSMNWLDGIDGLSGGTTFIGALTIFFLSLKPEVNQPPMGIISMALAGSILGFLIFNFFPSRIMAGTSGAMFMGFILAAMAIFAGTKIATAILVMSLPVIDSLWVIGERLKNKESIFQPDQRHLHHKLLALGWSQRKIAFLFYATTVLISIVALNTRFIGKSITLILTLGIMVIFLVFINEKTKKIA